MHRRVFVAAWLLLMVTCLISQGCIRANFTEPISTFQESINNSASAIGSYYTSLNRFERDRYLDERLFDPMLHVSATENNKPTPLTYQVFSPEGIKARTDSIVLLGLYANRLGTLAGTSAPADFRGAAGKLGENLDNLVNRFRTLAASGDPTAVNYAGPVSKITGIVGEQILEKRREELLEKAIKDGAPEVENILDQLEKDMGSLIQPLQTTGLKIALANRVDAYNDRVDQYRAELEVYNQSLEASEKARQAGKPIPPAPQKPVWPIEDRQKRLADIQAAAEQYELAVIADPVNLIQGMRDAHGALVKYAVSDKKPENLAEVVAALETFKAQVEVLSTAIKELLNRGKFQ